MTPSSRSLTEPLLFTPGPLTTSATVKQAMLRDAGSWQPALKHTVWSLREQLLEIAGLSRADDWEAILLQGSGTYGVEAVLGSCVPAHGKVCILSNGVYGERMIRICEQAGIPHRSLRSPESEPVDFELLDATLAAEPEITHVAVVHCETTTGILNPIVEVGRRSRRHGCVLIVDAMSSFGAVPINFTEAGIDILISSPNKCLEGVPGFCFVLARRAMILAQEMHARSLSLNLAVQLRGFDDNGQFRFTPPPQAIFACAQALEEYKAEGGLAARQRRYQVNHSVLVQGMRQLGFMPFLSPAVQSSIITAFHSPADARFQFDGFYQRLADKGFVIYHGNLSEAETFRIANIGHLFEADVRALVAAVAAVKTEMGFNASRLQPAAAPRESLQALPLLL